MLIYSNILNSRIEYTFRIVFNCLGKGDYSLTDSLEDFNAFQGPAINYSDLESKHPIQIRPNELMKSNRIENINLNISEYNSHLVFFSDPKGECLPYDPIASIFFLCSRYEEYQVYEPDEHNRFTEKNSVLYKWNVIKKPLAHYFFNDIIEVIRKHNAHYSIAVNDYSFIPSFDIDNAYAYRHKSLIRTVGGLLNSILSDFTEFKTRLNVLSGLQTDPYDTYDYIKSINEKFNVRPLFFILTSSKGHFDRNIKPHSKAFKTLILRLKKEGKIGLHPSYSSNNNFSQLNNEKKMLESVNQEHIIKSRQHFLKLKLPETYLKLIDIGIKDDFTMGYSGTGGFRAGICVPFPFYNLKEEKTTNLMIHPFCFMESTYQYYSKLDLDQIKEELSELIKEVKKVNGIFMPVWHNESLGEWTKWKGWRSVFEYMYANASD